MMEDQQAIPVDGDQSGMSFYTPQKDNVAHDIPATQVIPLEQENVFVPKEEFITHFDISITDPETIGAGTMSAYVTYRVHTKTDLPNFKEPKLVAVRRYSDFFLVT